MLGALRCKQILRMCIFAKTWRVVGLKVHHDMMCLLCCGCEAFLPLGLQRRAKESGQFVRNVVQVQNCEREICHNGVWLTSPPSCVDAIALLPSYVAPGGSMSILELYDVKILDTFDARWTWHDVEHFQHMADKMLNRNCNHHIPLQSRLNLMSGRGPANNILQHDIPILSWRHSSSYTPVLRKSMRAQSCYIPLHNGVCSECVLTDK